MDIQDYCSGLQSELSGWKEKVQDVAVKFDRRATGDKDKVAHEIRNIHMIVEELSDRIERLKNACQTQWEPDNIELESSVTQRESNWQGVWDKVSPADIGG